MTNEEREDAIKFFTEVSEKEVNNAKYSRLAIEALEQQPCENCISRVKAIEEADKLCLETDYDNEKVIEMLNDLPPVTQKEKTGWIPVSERLPDKLQDVLITFYDAEGEYDVAYMRKTFNETYKAHGSENEWVSSMGETTYADYEVSAWMPIEPYKAESEEVDNG